MRTSSNNGIIGENFGELLHYIFDWIKAHKVIALIDREQRMVDQRPSPTLGLSTFGQIRSGWREMTDDAPNNTVIYP